jgi:hypothetical protein
MKLHQLLVGAAAMTLCIAGQASATSYLVVQTYGSPTNDSVYLQTQDAAGPLSTSGSSTSMFGSSSSYSALADYGVHKVWSNVSSAAFQDSGTAYSQWIDTLHINSAREGVLYFGIDISAMLAADPVAVRGPGSADAALQYQISTLSSVGSTSYARNASDFSGVSGGFTYFNMAGYTGSETILDSGGTFHRFAVIPIRVAAGSDFVSFNSQANCHAQAIGDGNDPPGVATASCDSGHSVYWGGILDFVDASGASISDFTITSDSGTDYSRSFVPTQAIPEPSVWAMLMLGFGFSGALLRRRRSIASA